MKRIQIHLEEDQVDFLDRNSNNRADFIRDIIEKYRKEIGDTNYAPIETLELEFYSLFELLSSNLPSPYRQDIKETDTNIYKYKTNLASTLNEGRSIVIEKERQVGITAFLVTYAIAKCVMSGNMKIAFVNKARMNKGTFRVADIIIKFAANDGYEINTITKNTSQIKFSNGANIEFIDGIDSMKNRLLGTNNEFDYMFLDEFDFMKGVDHVVLEQISSISKGKTTVVPVITVPGVAGEPNYTRNDITEYIVCRAKAGFDYDFPFAHKYVGRQDV